MSAGDDSKSFPQSMRHRQILDVAEENPDASIEELASMVPSATADLVEQVFEKHGDPAGDETSTDAVGETPTDEDANENEETQEVGGSSSDGDTGSATGGGTDDTESTDEGINDDSNAVGDDDTATRDETTAGRTDGTAPDEDDASAEYPSLDDLSEKQREVLALVAAQPEATQEEIGDRLNVSRATVSNRVNSIEDFEWSERESFVEMVSDELPAPEMATSASSTDDDSSRLTTDKSVSTGTDGEERLAKVEADLERLESRLSDLDSRVESTTDDSSVFEDPELVHKVVHACMESDVISESEELRILQGLLE